MPASQRQSHVISIINKSVMLPSSLGKNTGPFVKVYNLLYMMTKRYLNVQAHYREWWLKAPTRLSLLRQLPSAAFGVTLIIYVEKLQRRINRHRSSCRSDQSSDFLLST